MKIRGIFFSAAAACLLSAAVCAVFATPAFAQAPKPKAEKEFQQYLASHPELQRDPGLMTDPRYLRAHPDFQNFLNNHPNVAIQARQMAANGAYDKKHQWRDRNWWTANDPKWTQQHHPEWVHQPVPGPGYVPQHPAHDQGYEAQHPGHDKDYEAHHEHEHD
jgi:hypothetical protein